MLNDYKGLKLIASSNPHIRNNEDTRSIMLDVIIALCPALIMSVIRFGFRALISVLVSVVSAMFFEWLYRKLMHKTQTLGDLSAAVTGVLLAFVCPVTLPYWMLIVGNFFAIFLVKQLYGGLALEREALYGDYLAHQIARLRRRAEGLRQSGSGEADGFAALADALEAKKGKWEHDNGT